MSKKRMAVYDALCATKTHPSAEMLYSSLKTEISDLSLGTVYRNLNVLMADGLVKCVGNINGQARYDADMSCHPHFVCTRCGRVIDIELPFETASLLPDAELSTGCKVSGVELSFFGLCKDCE